MRSRAWIAILVIGVLGLVMMGFLTKFAIDSNKELQGLIRFKAAFADSFRVDGIREIAVRRGRAAGGYRMVLTWKARVAHADSAGPADASPDERQALGPSVPTGASGPLRPLDERILGYFLENFPDRSARLLEIAYMAPGSFGCSAATLDREIEVAVPQFRAWRLEMDRRKRLSEALAAAGCRAVEASRDGAVQRVDLRPLEAGATDPGALARRAEPILRQHFRLGGYNRLLVRVLPADGSAAGSPAPPIVEVRFDSRGSEVSG